MSSARQQWERVNIGENESLSVCLSECMWLGERVNERKYTVIEHNASTMITSASRNYSQRKWKCAGSTLQLAEQWRVQRPVFRAAHTFPPMARTSGPERNNKEYLRLDNGNNSSSRNRKIPLYDGTHLAYSTIILNQNSNSFCYSPPTHSLCPIPFTC